MNWCVKTCILDALKFTVFDVSISTEKFVYLKFSKKPNVC